MRTVSHNINVIMYGLAKSFFLRPEMWWRSAVVYEIPAKLPGVSINVLGGRNGGRSLLDRERSSVEYLAS